MPLQDDDNESIANGLLVPVASVALLRSRMVFRNLRPSGCVGIYRW
jgi:hypothetical protein